MTPEGHLRPDAERELRQRDGADARGGQPHAGHDRRQLADGRGGEREKHDRDEGVDERNQIQLREPELGELRRAARLARISTTTHRYAPDAAPRAFVVSEIPVKCDSLSRSSTWTTFA